MAKPYVNVNGIKLAYEERGSGEPLVLIMGLGADGPVWDLHARAYAEKFRCFLVDNRGTGESDKPEGPYTTARMADDYAGLIRELGLGKVRVAGISMGGAIAQELALRHPDLVRSLVLVCTWAKFEPYAVQVFDNLANLRAVATPEVFLELLHLWIWTPAYINAHAAEMAEGRAAANAGLKDGSWMPTHAFAAQASACNTHDTTGRLQNIRVPVLLTIGTADIFTPMAYTEYLHKHIAGSEVVTFPGWGHVHHWEDLERFNQVTRDWLEGH
ncbi:MAG: alpha/beta fold hydrolase [Fibrobacteria bacterium]|jgi:pimeloyl-ACP methyl ester carboxylesterase|nr:alpha/beta fold hydrolase [Fibrobacteria bacterium]